MERKEKLEKERKSLRRQLKDRKENKADVLYKTLRISPKRINTICTTITSFTKKYLSKVSSNIKQKDDVEKNRELQSAYLINVSEYIYKRGH